MAGNRIIVIIIGKLLSRQNAMYRSIIVIIAIIAKKIDIRTKNIFDIVILSRVYIILFMTIMTIICQWLMFLFDNSNGNNGNKSPTHIAEYLTIGNSRGV